MRLRLSVDFTLDHRGRIVLTNEPFVSARCASPDLVIGVVDAGTVTLASARLPDAVVERLATDSLELEAIKRELSALGKWTLGGGPVYRFPQNLASGEAFELTELHRPLLRRHFAWLDAEFGLWGRVFGIERDGSIVSVCFSSRLNAQAAEAGLQTAPDYRGRGLAAIVSSGWADSVRGLGLIPFYSTSRQNTASQAVARKLGLIRIGEDYSFTRSDASKPR